MSNQTFNYTSRDFSSVLADLIRRTKVAIPEWTSYDQGFEKIIFENYAYVADILNFYIDRMGNEAFVQTAVLRQSMLNLAQQFGYIPSPQTAAVCTVQFTAPTTLSEIVLIPAGTRMYTQSEGKSPIYFETVADVQIAANAGVVAVDAKEGTSVIDEPIGMSNGMSIQQMPLFISRVIKDSVRIFTQDGPGATPSLIEWNYFERMIDARFNDRAFTTFTDDAGYTSVLFGDAVSGRIPAVNVNVLASYRYGVGSLGNIGLGAIKGLVEGGVLSSKINGVTNTTAAQGGADIESIESMRSSIPKSLRTLNRAVTTDDYAALALKVAGVAKSSATALVSTNVSVYIAPVGDVGAPPVQTLLDAVSVYLNKRKMIGTTVTVSVPTYVFINITIDVAIDQRYRKDNVITSVNTALTDLFAFSSREFGELILYANVFSAIKDLPGVVWPKMTVHARAGLTTMGDIQLLPQEIAKLGAVVITSSGGVTPS